MPDNSLRTHDRLTHDFLFFAKHCLQVKNKSGRLVPFELNFGQTFIHNKLEEQKQLTGRVRALILKARQMGCSTYIAGRFYHKNNRIPNKSTFILSHQAATTGALFSMVDRYHEICPGPAKPKAIVSNKRQLKFENGSEYTVGTAGSGDVGRGFTTQLLHLSEVAFFENTDDIQTGILQSVSDEEGTEIIAESTANGMNNWFYQACMDALQGKGDYILIFLPWFWQPEYRREVPPDFAMTPEEIQYAETYGLNEEQIFWRRKKIEDLKSEWKFMQEYPANVMEAFQTSGDSLIDAEKAMRARKRNILNNSTEPLILGVDPARTNDRTVLTLRRGRKIVEYKVYDLMDEMRLAGIIVNLIESRGVDKCFVDKGYGYGTIDRLHELGYRDKVIGVHFSERPIEDDKFLNKRSEMAFAVRDWIGDDDVDIPDDDNFFADLLSIPDAKETSRGLWYIESKDNIKKNYGRSPDIFDSLMLTFAYPVRKNLENTTIRKKIDGVTGKSGGPLKTLNRTRRNRRP
jgi:hypothetical protein